MTLQTASDQQLEVLAQPTVLKFPFLFFFQPIWVSSFVADSTCFRLVSQHNESRLVNHTPGVLQVQAGLKYWGEHSTTS